MLHTPPLAKKWGIGGKYLNAELSSPIQATHGKKVQEIFAQ